MPNNKAASERIEADMIRGLEMIEKALKPTAQAAHRRTADGCSYCEQYYADSMMPHHDASEACKSGKREHCTCDACF